MTGKQACFSTSSVVRSDTIVPAFTSQTNRQKFSAFVSVGAEIHEAHNVGCTRFQVEIRQSYDLINICLDKNGHHFADDIFKGIFKEISMFWFEFNKMWQY